MLLWVVLIEDPSRGALEQALLVAAANAADAAAIVRAYYDSEGRKPAGFELTVQSFAEVFGPAGTLYRVTLRRVPIGNHRHRRPGT